MISQKFFGINTIFWIGVVESRDDSKASDKFKLGRVQVRILGFHSEKLEEDDASGEGIPREKLPWAYPINSITSASMNGVGQTPLGVVEGTWVVGISLDGPAMQDLYILGTLGGLPQEIANTQSGFSDPSGCFPRKDFLKEEDTNRLARNDSKKKHPMLAAKEKLRKKDIEIANPGAKRPKWSEPSSPYQAKYPYNHVYESEHGHIKEIDDTPEDDSGSGGPRTLDWHPTGTYTEVHKDGSKVQKIKGESFEIVLSNKNLYVKGDLNITVDGDARLLVKGNCITEVEKDIIFESSETILLKADKNLVVAAKDMQILAENSITMIAGGPFVAIGNNSSAADLSMGSI